MALVRERYQATRGDSQALRSYDSAGVIFAWDSISGNVIINQHVAILVSRTQEETLKNLQFLISQTYIN
jgi:hypothetical protein